MDIAQGRSFVYGESDVMDVIRTNKTDGTYNRFTAYRVPKCMLLVQLRGKIKSEDQDQGGRLMW